MTVRPVRLRSIYIFSLFTSVEQIIKTTVFPTRDQFYSKLKRQHVDQELYDKMKSLFEHRISLPDDHPQKWKNMTDYLKYYNELDVQPLVNALEKCFKSFKICAECRE